MEIHREQFVSSKDFLKSARDLGIGVEKVSMKLWIIHWMLMQKTFGFTLRKRRMEIFDLFSQTMAWEFQKNISMKTGRSIRHPVRFDIRRSNSESI